MLDQLGALRAGDDDRRRNQRAVGLRNGVGAAIVAAIGEGSIDFAQKFGGAVAIAADHDSIGKQEVGDGRAFAKKLRIGGYIEALGVGAIAKNDSAHPVAGVDRNCALLDDDFVVLSMPPEISRATDST